MSTAITTSRPVDRTESHTASFATRWLQPSVAVITAHGDLDASNAQEFVDYALRDAERTAALGPGPDRRRLLRHRRLFRAAHAERALRGCRCRVGAGAQQRGQSAVADLRSGFGPADRGDDARSAVAASAPNSVGYCNWSRSRARDFASSRDTCICEMPTRSAICVWVSDSKNLSTSTVRSRSGSASSKGRNASRFSI